MKFDEYLDNEFAEIVENLQRKQVIIWGATSLCERLMLALDCSVNEFEIWDTNKAGNQFCGLEIGKPKLNDPDVYKKSYVILAFYTEKSYTECTEALISAGYKNIINGSKLLEYIVMLKIKSDYDLYQKNNTDENFLIDNERLWTWSSDIYQSAGTPLNDYYLVQDLWAAKKVFSKMPPIHYDIGSSVSGFISHLLSFGMKTVLIDIRSLNTYGTENLTFFEEDATFLSKFEDNSIESMSALCSLEHFGLGRYGDPVDPDAHKKAFKNIQRVLKKNGDFYMSVPVSNHCVLQFNAHRIYSPQYILEQFNLMELVEFSRTSNEGLIKDASIVGVGDYNNVETVGLFHFRKK